MDKRTGEWLQSARVLLSGEQVNNVSANNNNEMVHERARGATEEQVTV